MPRSPSRSSRPAPHLLLLALALAACGGEEAPAAAPTAAEDSARAAALEEDSLYGATAAENVRVTPVEIEVPGLPEGWNGMRVAAVSDLQIGLWPDNERVARAALERAVRERPDMVVLLGDYLARGADLAALDRVLQPLQGRPVFAVLGNADEIDDPQSPDTARARLVQALERNGVRVLRNARAPFARGGDTAYVAGVEPYTARRPDWRQAEIFGGIPGGGARTPLLLSHMPAVLAHVPEDKYPAILAGHTFCGQAEVPGTPRLSWLNTEVFPGTTPPGRRIYRMNGSTLFVTCGVGYSFVPVRFGHPPEVAMVTLRAQGGMEKPGAGAAAGDSAPRQPNLDSLLQVYQRPRPRDTTRTREEGGTGGDTTTRADTAAAQPDSTRRR